MGQYSPCNKDDLEPEEENGENNYLEYISYNLKTWKKINLNSFISKISLGEKNNYNIFCIINGNKGNEISKFVQNHFLDELLNEIKEKKDIKIAIRESFLKMNKLIEGKEGMKEIYELRLKNNEEEIKNYKNVINENKEEKINIFQEEDKEILDYTGCTLCLIIIDSELNKIYFGNIGNSELFIYKNNNSKDIINIKSQHRPNDETEKSRIKNTSLIINNKLYGVLKSSRSFGNFAYNGENNIIIDEPDIKEYDINDEDKYIFIANETFVDILKNENVGELIKRREEAGDISLEGIIEGILDKNISNYFFNNDIESGFDNITCTLIKLKNK
jgi:protein phosphatase 2C family protein 2/3